MSTVLDGLTVLDASTLLAGPLAGGMLADFGARVIKVEDPTNGDPIRGFPPMTDGVSLGSKVTNRGKECITLNLRVPRGQEIFRQLGSRSDVVITNLRLPTLQRWQLDYDRLSSANPGLILLHITGFGRTGPYADRPGFARVAEAFSGLMGITGDPDGPPTPAGYPIVDGITGAMGALGVVLAIQERDRSGRGQIVDVSLVDSVLRLLEDFVVDYAETGKVRPRAGSANINVAPNGLFCCGDDVWIVIPASTDQVFVRLCAAMGRPELAELERFADNASRVAHRSELDDAIGDWCRSRTSYQVGDALDRAGVAWSRVQSASDLLADRHMWQRGSVLDVYDPELDRALTMQGVTPALSRTPGSIEAPGKPKGADTEQILGDELGLSAAELSELQASGVI